MTWVQLGGGRPGLSSWDRGPPATANRPPEPRVQRLRGRTAFAARPVGIKLEYPGAPALRASQAARRHDREEACCSLAAGKWLGFGELEYLNHHPHAVVAIPRTATPTPGRFAVTFHNA
jgi:hypothetical protein